jgi:hypothetical protein
MTGKENDLSIGAYATDGGTVNVGGPAIGTVNNHYLGSASRSRANGRVHQAEVGILTVLDEEMQAVVERLQGRKRTRLA